MKPKISIIIPVYNVERYLDKCIKSILNQTFKEFELILINDGSTDNSKSICDYYSKKYDEINVIHKENEGQASARNIGLDIAKGEYIGFVDSDDFIEEDMFEELYKSCIEYDSDIAIIGLREVDENYTILNEYIPTEINLKEIFKRAYPCNKIFKKKLFIENKLKFSAGKYYEDVELIPKLYVKAQNITLVKKIGYNYLRRKNSTTTSRDKKILDNLWAYTQVKDYLVEESLYEKYESEFNESIQNLKLYFYNILYDYSTVFLIKNLSQIKYYFNKIGSIKFKEYLIFSKRHSIFTIKRFIYDIGRKFKNKKKKIIKYFDRLKEMVL